MRVRPHVLDYTNATETSSSSSTVVVMGSSGSATVFVVSNRFLPVLSSSPSASTAQLYLYQGDTGQAINTAVVNPLNTRTHTHKHTHIQIHIHTIPTVCITCPPSKQFAGKNSEEAVFEFLFAFR